MPTFHFMLVSIKYKKFLKFYWKGQLYQCHVSAELLVPRTCLQNCSKLFTPPSAVRGTYLSPGAYRLLLSRIHWWFIYIFRVTPRKIVKIKSSILARYLHAWFSSTARKIGVDSNQKAQFLGFHSWFWMHDHGTTNSLKGVRQQNVSC